MVKYVIYHIGKYNLVRKMGNENPRVSQNNADSKFHIFMLHNEKLLNKTVK